MKTSSAVSGKRNLVPRPTRKNEKLLHPRPEEKDLSKRSRGGQTFKGKEGAFLSTPEGKGGKVLRKESQLPHRYYRRRTAISN